MPTLSPLHFLITISKVGVRYAAKLCVALNAELIVMNVLKIDQLNQMRSGFTEDNSNIKKSLKRAKKNGLTLLTEIR